MRRSPLFSLLVAGGLLCGLVVSVEEAHAQRDRRTLLLAGKYYLVGHPNDARTLGSVGCMEAEMGSYDDAIVHLSKAIQLQPFENAYYIDRADAYLHHGDYQKAIDDANVVMKSNNGTELGLALANRGESYYRLGNYKQAFADLNRAIHYLPDLGGTYFYRARVYEKMGQKALAEADYARARQRGFVTDGQQEVVSK